VTAFVDTSAFYAVIDGDDERHEAARNAWERLLDGRDTLHTTNYVLVETIALLHSRIGMDGLRTFTADVMPILAVTWVDEGTHRSAHHALLVSSRRALSLVDCVSFEVMRRQGIDRVFCFDDHFAEQGFQVID
jgi:predicted nucleic acid-binding protein